SDMFRTTRSPAGSGRQSVLLWAHRELHVPHHVRLDRIGPDYGSNHRPMELGRQCPGHLSQRGVYLYWNRFCATAWFPKRYVLCSDDHAGVVTFGWCCAYGRCGFKTVTVELSESE